VRAFECGPKGIILHGLEVVDLQERTLRHRPSASRMHPYARTWARILITCSTSFSLDMMSVSSESGTTDHAISFSPLSDSLMFVTAPRLALPHSFNPSALSLPSLSEQQIPISLLSHR
jgi:hypothetical protein